MANAIASASTLDPEACRRAARDRFPARRTVERYLDLYHAVARNETKVASWTLRP
jgi:hypothetical protein